MVQKDISGSRASDAFGDSLAYRIKEHPRAKHVHLKLSRQGELEIVVPKGYDRRAIPEVIAAKQAWLGRTRTRLRQQMQSLPAEYFQQWPASVRLRALAETYTVLFRPTTEAHIRIAAIGRILSVSGPVHDASACACGLRAWLRIKARRRLPPWLRQTSQELGLPYAKTIIRGQRSRWGSCSAQGVISLNYKLLFLPRAQVHYLFVHELCHTRHLNHSARYWALVARKLPDYRRFEATLREAWRYVPRWAGD